MIHTPVSRVGRFTRITTYPSRFRFDIIIILIDGDLDVTSAVPRTTHYYNFIGILLLRIRYLPAFLWVMWLVPLIKRSARTVIEKAILRWSLLLWIYASFNAIFNGATMTRWRIKKNYLNLYHTYYLLFEFKNYVRILICIRHSHIKTWWLIYKTAWWHHIVCFIIYQQNTIS